jgi:hypothetical protein
MAVIVPNTRVWPGSTVRKIGPIRTAREGSGSGAAAAGRSDLSESTVVDSVTLREEIQTPGTNNTRIAT